MNKHELQDQLWEIQNRGGRVQCLEGLSVEDATLLAYDMGFEEVLSWLTTWDLKKSN
jgi:hypothetical protein